MARVSLRLPTREIVVSNPTVPINDKNPWVTRGSSSDSAEIFRYLFPFTNSACTSNAAGASKMMNTAGKMKSSVGTSIFVAAF